MEPGFLFDKLPFEYKNFIDFSRIRVVVALNKHGWFIKRLFLQMSYFWNFSFSPLFSSTYDYSYNLSFQNFLKSKTLVGFDAEFFDYIFIEKHFPFF